MLRFSIDNAPDDVVAHRVQLHVASMHKDFLYSTN